MRQARHLARGAAAAVVAGLLALFCLPGLAAAEPALPAGFQDEVVLANLNQPTAFRFAADGRVFVAQKTGEIKVFDSGLGDTSPEVFADLRTFVYDRGDRGLLGMALDPKFDEGRPYVYALYTYDHILGDPSPPPKWGKPDSSGDPCPDENGGDACLVSGLLVRLTAEGDKAKEVGGEPEQKVLAEGWCQQFSSHSIGDLEFGPEGALYASGGDGASFFGFDYGQLGNPVANPCGDPPGGVGVALSPPDAEGGSLRSQNLKVLNGKLLRLDPDSGQGLASNPMGSSADENTRRIVAAGFRNPFRFAFDQVTGDVYVANVGSSEIEEIDRVPSIPSTIFNSGWPCYEGPDRQFLFEDKGLDVCDDLYGAEPGSTSPPFFYYSHGQTVVPDDECPIEFGSALGGISLYQGDKMPGYKGALFFADAVRGCVWAMRVGDDGRPDPATTERFFRDERVYPAIDIQEGPDGYLYYANLLGDENGADGAIHKLVYKPGAPKARLTATPPYGVALPLNVEFDAGGSTDPDGDPLTYDWDLDEDGVYEIEGTTDTTQSLQYTKAEQDERDANDEPLNRVVTVRVSDDDELTSVAAVTVYPGDKPPEVTITSPAPSLKWGVGDSIHISGTAKDAQGQTMFEPLPYYWSTRLFHCPDPAQPENCHGHPLQVFAGARSGDFTAPEHDYPSYIEITLRVASARGLVGFKTVKIDPRTVTLDFSSVPAGVELTAGLLQGPSPFSLTAIEGSNVQLSAPATAEIGGKTYTWQSWSDGGGRAHAVIADSDLPYVATYTTPEEPGGGPDPGPGPIPGPAPAPQPAPTSPVTPSTPPVIPPVDMTPPQTGLTGHPPKRTTARAARFAFSASEAGSSFRCKLDRGAFRPCVSPQAYRGLKLGPHRFKVIATDASGNADATPAGFGWKVLAKPRR